MWKQVWLTSVCLALGCAGGERLDAASGAKPSLSEPGDSSYSLPEPIVSRPEIPQLVAGCEGQSLWMLRENVLSRLSSDGTQVPLIELGKTAGMKKEEVVVLGWHAKGKVAAVAAFLHRQGKPVQYEYVLIDISGNVLFHRVQAEPHNPYIFLSDDGALSVSGANGFVVKPDGQVKDLGTLLPVSPLLGAHVLVALGQPFDDGTSYAWLNVETLVLTPPSEPLTSNGPLGFAQGRVLYAAANDRLVVASGPLDTLTVTAPGLEQSSVVTTSQDERFVLLQSWAGPDLWRLDVLQGTLEPVATGAPNADDRAGMDALAPQGDILRPFELADGRLQLRRSSTLGASWTDVGAPMSLPVPGFGAGPSLTALARGQRVLVVSMDRGYGDFLQELQLVSVGMTTPSQHVSVGGMWNSSLPWERPLDLSADGACAATWVQRSGSVFSQDGEFDLVFVDPVTQTTQVVATDVLPSELRFVPSP